MNKKYLYAFLIVVLISLGFFKPVNADYVCYHYVCTSTGYNGGTCEEVIDGTYSALSTCNANCQDECSSNLDCCLDECSYSGETQYQCSGNTLQKRTCGDYDFDPCLDWSSWQNVENCDTKDGWYGGGNVQGCGDDPSSEYRDYYCSGGSCSYTVTATKDCDNYDICSGICNPSTGDIERNDSYVIQNSNTCTWTWAGVVYDCSDTCSDSDGGINLDSKGTVTDEELCSSPTQTSCPVSTYTDYCIDNTHIREYYCSGNDYAYEDLYVGNGYLCTNGKRIEALDIKSSVSTFSIEANGVYAFKIKVKNLLSDNKQITIYPPEVYNSTGHRLTNLDSVVEEYSYNGNDVRGKTLSFSGNEEKELDVIIKTPEDIKPDSYRIKFAVKSQDGVYDEIEVRMNIGVVLIPIEINARAYDSQGNAVKNALVKGFVCPVNVEWCDKGFAMFWNQTYTNETGHFHMIINAFLELGKEYKVSVVTEKGYAEAVFSTG